MNHRMIKLFPQHRAALALCIAILAGALPAAHARKNTASSEPRTISAWVASTSRAESASSERWTVFVQDLSTGGTILDFNGDRRLIPASNRKIVPFSMALSKLGPEFRFKTELGLSRVVGRTGSTLTGSVVLRSNGDPTLQERFLNQRNPATVIRQWIGTLAESGVARIQGDFIIDASAFGRDQNAHPAAWGDDHVNYTYAPHPSAISINDNLLRVRANPSSSGGKGRLTLYPSLGGVDVVNLTNSGSGKAGGLDARFEQTGALKVTGSLGGKSAGQEVAVPIERPLDYIRGIVIDELDARGITVAGRVRILTDPAESKTYPMEEVLAGHQSPPLIELLHVMMRDSDNFLAEQIWRGTAYHVSGRGDSEGARKVESDFYRTAGLSQIQPGYDGSGLSRQNYFSGRDFVQVLRAVYSSAYRPYLIDCLPSSGRSGTLRGRTMGGAPGRVVAKTGTLDGSQALSGFIRDELGRERWVFGIVANGRPGSNSIMKNRINILMGILMNTMDGRTGADLGDDEELLVADGREAGEASSRIRPARLGSDDDSSSTGVSARAKVSPAAAASRSGSSKLTKTKVSSSSSSSARSVSKKKPVSVGTGKASSASKNSSSSSGGSKSKSPGGRRS